MDRIVPEYVDAELLCFPDEKYLHGGFAPRTNSIDDNFGPVVVRGKEASLLVGFFAFRRG